MVIAPSMARSAIIAVVSGTLLTIPIKTRSEARSSRWSGKRQSAVGLREVPPRSLTPHHSLNMVHLEQAPTVPEAVLIDLSDEQDNEFLELQKTLEEDKQYLDSLLAIKETDLPLYSMSCNDVYVDVLIDSGVSGSYVAPVVFREKKW